MISYNPKEWFSFIFRFHKADTFRKLLPLMGAVGLYSGLVAWLELEYWQLGDESVVKNITITHSMLEKGSVIYDEVLSHEPQEAVDVIFLSVLSHPPAAEDRRLAREEIRTAENPAAGCGNLIWALLNTREFIFIQ